MAVPWPDGDPTMLALVTAKRAFLTLFDEHAPVFVDDAVLAVDTLRAERHELASVAALQALVDSLQSGRAAYAAATSEFARQTMPSNAWYFDQLAFDRAVEIVELCKRVVVGTHAVVAARGIYLSSTVPIAQEKHQREAVPVAYVRGADHSFRQVEDMLERVFPVVSSECTYGLRFVQSGHFLENGSYVNCGDDVTRSNGQFELTPVRCCGASSVVTPAAISLGASSKFGVRSYCWRQREHRFVCKQSDDRNGGLQSRTWLRGHEEWVAVSPFRSLEYTRSLRVGDLFFLGTALQPDDRSHKFMASVRDSSRLALRHSPNASCYMVALSGAHERFIYAP